MNIWGQLIKLQLFKFLGMSQLFKVIQKLAIFVKKLTAVWIWQFAFLGSYNDFVNNFYFLFCCEVLTFIPHTPLCASMNPTQRLFPASQFFHPFTFLVFKQTLLLELKFHVLTCCLAHCVNWLSTQKFKREYRKYSICPYLQMNDYFF